MLHRYCEASFLNRLLLGLVTMWGHFIIQTASLLPGLRHFEMEMWQMLVPFPPSSRWRNAVCNLDSQAPLVTSLSCSRCPAVAGHQRAFVSRHIWSHLMNSVCCLNKKTCRRVSCWVMLTIFYGFVSAHVKSLFSSTVFRQRSKMLEMFPFLIWRIVSLTFLLVWINIWTHLI